MKDWILKHKKLYFFIVGVIAFIAFMAITLHGVKRASAATTNGSISVPYGESSVYALSLRDYPYYVVFTNYLNDKERFVAFLTDEPMSYGNGFSDTDLLSGGVRALYVRREKNGEGEYVVIEESLESGMAIRYLPTNSSEVYSNYDIMRGPYEVVFSANPLSGTPSFTGYQWETGPYLDFERLYMRNDVIQNSIGFFGRLTGWKSIMDAYSDARWEYVASLKNPVPVTEGKLSCDISMNITFPTAEFVYGWFDRNVYDFGYSNVAKHSAEMMLDWTKTKSSSNSVTFTVVFNDYLVEYDPSGFVSYQFSYIELFEALKEQAIDNKDASFFQYIESIEEDIEQFAFALYMHVESFSSVVTATFEVPYGPPNIVYGRQVVDIFTYGVLNDAISLNVNVDVYNSSEAEIKDAYNDAFKIGYENHNQQMQDRIDGLEDALDSIYQVDGTLSGDLSATDLWDGFWNLSRGLASLGKSVDNLSSLTGSVFAFMPSPITSIMQYTLIAICVIAIIKAIRG